MKLPQDPIRIGEKFILALPSTHNLSLDPIERYVEQRVDVALLGLHRAVKLGEGVPRWEVANCEVV